MQLVSESDVKEMVQKVIDKLAEERVCEKISTALDSIDEDHMADVIEDLLGEFANSLGEVPSQ